MTPIKRIIKQGKGRTVEFAQSLGEPALIAAHVVGFLNSGGGYVIIGVDDDGRVADVPNADQVAEDLQIYLTQHISPRALFDVGVDLVNDQSVVVVDVPGGKDIPFVTSERVYLRRGVSTVAASGDDLHELLQARVVAVERWERRVSPTLSEEDLVFEELRDTVHASQENKRAMFPRFEDDPFPVISSLGMETRGGFTNAADICFGRDPAVRHSQVILRAFAFETDKGGDFVDQQVFSGPIVQMIDQAVAFIRGRVAVTAEFLDDQLRRLDRSIYPNDIVREGLVNALAHRDYASFSGGVTIEIYPARVEIWNSGTLPDGWNAQRLRSPHPSLPSNPDIAQVLYIRGFMERIGRGTLKMIQTCREEGLPAPRWRVDNDGVTLTLFSRASRFAPEVNLNDRQRNLLVKLKTDEPITVRYYHTHFAEDISERQARRDLQVLADADLLRKDGRGPSTRYVRTDRKV